MNNQMKQRRRICYPQSNMPKSELPNLSLAMAYVPVQTWQEIYNAPAALCRGTVFCQLDLPFGGAQ